MARTSEDLGHFLDPADLFPVRPVVARSGVSNSEARKRKEEPDQQLHDPSRGYDEQ